MPPVSPLPKIRELARQLVVDKGIDDHRLVDQFIAEVESAYRTLTARISSRQVPQKMMSKIGRGRAVAAACDALHMDPPRRGKRINMRKALSQKRLLVRSFHPDSGSGDRERLAEVIAAYETLDLYSRLERNDHETPQE